MSRWSWTALPRRHSGVGAQHHSSTELHSDDGCLQNERKLFKVVARLNCNQVPRWSEAAITRKGLVVFRTHPCCHLFRQQFWPRFFQHSDALQSSNQRRGVFLKRAHFSLNPNLGSICLCKVFKRPCFFYQFNSTNLWPTDTMFSCTKSKLKVKRSPRATDLVLHRVAILYNHLRYCILHLYFKI